MGGLGEISAPPQRTVSTAGNPTTFVGKTDYRERTAGDSYNLPPLSLRPRREMVFCRWGELETGGILGGGMEVHTIDKSFGGMEWNGLGWIRWKELRCSFDVL